MSKFSELNRALKKLGRIVVAYSGGLDSTFLLKAAVGVLGKRNVLAVTARSETYPLSEYKQSLSAARSIGARHISIHTDELSSKKFTSNPVNRCYYCKKELFRKLSDIRDRYGMKYIVDGTNFDDLKDIRHGTKAAEEFGVKRPLLEARLTKKDISRLSKKMKLPTWNKPSAACLASRFAFNSRITKFGLKKVGEAEEFLKGMGFSQVRVRLHGPIARIELLKKEIWLASKNTEKISNKLKRLGFTYITLDLEGYRTGSMHEAV